MLFTKQTNGDEQGNVMRTIQRSINTSNMIDIIQINSVINVYLYCYDGCCAYVYNTAAMIMYRNSSNNGNTNNNNSNKNNINVNKVTSKLVIPSDHDYKYIYCYTNNYNGENLDALKSNSKSVSNIESNAASFPFSESPQATVLPMITIPQLIARTDVNVALKLAVNLLSVISDDKETEVQGQDTEKGKGKRRTQQFNMTRINVGLKGFFKSEFSGDIVIISKSMDVVQCYSILSKVDEIYAKHYDNSVYDYSIMNMLVHQ